MPNLKPVEWLIIIAVIVLLFGAKRLPDAARGLGRSLRILKAETKGLADDAPDADASIAPPAVPPAAIPSTPDVAAPKPEGSPTERAEG
ncbi:MAG: Sec-independent protein translocase subunit TatA [Actinobacteria bacterium]|nr:Sec-independent protein translocase subunit TatA [Actinomycetota bacterium]